MQDRRVLAHERGDLEAHVAMIADEFRRGFEAVDRIPRPAVTVFGSARIRRGRCGLRARPRVRTAARARPGSR